MNTYLSLSIQHRNTTLSYLQTILSIGLLECRYGPRDRFPSTPGSIGSNLRPTTTASIRSVISVGFDLAALREFIPALERNPMTFIRIKRVSKHKKKIAKVRRATGPS
jgi:hypothetical protein